MDFNFNRIIEEQSEDFAKKVKTDISEEMKIQIIDKVKKDGIFILPLESDNSSSRLKDTLELTCLIFEKNNEATIEVYFHIYDYHNIKLD